ncbi:MAG TPA: hypothetical protein V6D48_04450, partial [Oculatellaceae cyanobacterium]
EKIYSLVSEKHQDDIPKLQDIRSYVKLHWSVVALKQAKLFDAAKMSFPASFSPAAWKLLGEVTRSRKRTEQPSLVQKLVLIKD